MDDAFYVPDGERFVATPNTQGPWEPGAQHGGPPSALLARAFERTEPRADMRIARITVEILGPVPVGSLAVATRVARPGRSVELLEAEVLDERERAVLRANAWRIVTAGAPRIAMDDEPPPGPEQGTLGRAWWTPADQPGYHRSTEWLFVDGALDQPGPARAWIRMLRPLVPGEEPTPLQRVMVAADSGNGISAVLDPRDHVFINTDLTVNIVRDLEGESVCLDSVTRVHESGIGITETILWDRRGRVGRATQTLLVRAR